MPVLFLLKIYKRLDIINIIIVSFVISLVYVSTIDKRSAR